jgi:acyl-CoA synthetase (AMP-forming)/AMP-acid ligase II/thioesterase domain-containing protein/acyl carrier protein
MARSRLVSLDAIAHYAESTPQSPALIEPDGATFSYKDLWAQIEMVSRRLEGAGIGAGERVALLLPQGGGEVLAATGVLNCHTAITLKTKSSTTEVEACLKMLSVSALIAAPEFEAQVEAAIGLGITVLVARKGESPKDWHIRVPALQLNPRNPPPEAVTFSFSSGTTGTSKIVPVTATNLNARITSLSNSVQLTASDRLLLMISQSFGVSVLYTHAQFSVGGVVIATEGFDPASYSSWLNKLRPTWYICAPTVHHATLSQLKAEPPSRPLSLRLIESSFAPLPEELRKELEQILGVPVLTQYGATEAGIIASESLSSGGRIPTRVGRSRGSEIGIMSSSGLLLPAGQEGEIAVRGPAVASGYVDTPELTRVAFRDGWYRTGDAGRLEADGNLYLTGRLKEIINRGGEKIGPAEVDAVLATHPAVLEAAAFALPHRTLGEAVACAVVLRGGDSPRVSAIELRRFLSERLAPFKVPHRIVFVGKIPRAELGKPQRWLLTERFGQGRTTPSDPAETWDPRLPYVTNDLRYKIREIWGRILDRDDVALSEDFFEAGGDSLAAVNMLSEVDERFGSKTSELAASFFDEPTIEHLTTLVGAPVFPRPAYGASNQIQIFPVRANGSGTRMYLAAADEDEGLYFRRLAKRLEGIIDVSVVRPANTFYSRSLFTFESAAEEMTKLILQEQGEGPYIVGGYCFGGVVAFEAARQLALGNRQVRLILFDVPMPGYPGFLCYVKNEFLSVLRRLLHEQRIKPDVSPGPTADANMPLSTTPTSMGKRMSQIAKSRSRMFLWYAISHARQSVQPLEKYRLIQRLLETSTREYFPVYRARPIDVPILHFLCAEELDDFMASSRLGWRNVARHGIEERSIPQNHMNALHESSLPAIVEVIQKWCGIYTLANRS